MVAATPPSPQPCDEQTLAKCLALMDILPKRNDDALTGKLRFNLYKRILGGYQNEALNYLAGQATTTCHWFPTPAECLTILRAWPNRDVFERRQGHAEGLIRREMQHRMNEALAVLSRREMTQEKIADLPDQWRRIAVDKGYLWKLTDGTYLIRPDTNLMTEEELEAHRSRVTKMIDAGMLA